MTRPRQGECITLVDYDSHPWLVVTAVDEASVRAVLCADLPPAYQDRIRQTVGDAKARQALVQSIRQTDLQRLQIPHQAIERLDQERRRHAPR